MGGSARARRGQPKESKFSKRVELIYNRANHIRFISDRARRLRAPRGPAAATCAAPKSVLRICLRPSAFVALLLHRSISERCLHSGSCLAHLLKLWQILLDLLHALALDCLPRVSDGLHGMMSLASAVSGHVCCAIFVLGFHHWYSGV